METIDDFHGSIMQHLKVGHRVIVRLISVNIKNGMRLTLLIYQYVIGGKKHDKCDCYE